MELETISLMSVELTTHHIRTQPEYYHLSRYEEKLSPSLLQILCYSKVRAIVDIVDI